MVKHALCVSLGVSLVALYLFLGLPLLQCLLLTVIGFLGLGGFNPTYRFIKNLPRDIQLIRTIKKISNDEIECKKANATIASCFRDVVSKYPSKVAILFEDQKWTFQELDSYSNKVASLLRMNGFKRGDCIALFMTNCPQYIGIMIGACKIGVEVALINSNLRDKGLFHCIKIANCSGIIYENTLEEALGNVSDQFDDKLQGMCFCCLSNALSAGRSFDTELQNQSDDPIPPLNDQSIKDVAFYIYTSGTTGLPKAVPMKYTRVLSMINGFKHSASIGMEEILYDPLPLYHTSGLVLTMGQCYTRGVTVALRKKFSASNFITDCIKYKCTTFCYIGELCRYILLQPPAPTDTQHSIVKCFGNGLRPDIWREFQKRFAISSIVEFYGSTEGNVAFVNLVNEVGAVGYLSSWMQGLLNIYFLKVDSTTGEVVRNANGFCTKVGPGEKGEIVRLIDKKNAFIGYKDTTATSKKILKDVFKKGDSYFSSGDIAWYDEDGYIYFCDRAGDTFRWKGENVSTTEVENTISSLIGHADTIVYGVEIPQMDGRAGMAAVVGTGESIGITQLATQLKSVLPSYAVPIFIRLVDSSRLTGTFKFQKVEYRKEGFDTDSIRDELYFLDPNKKTYVPLTKDMQEKIANGGVRL